MGTFDNATKHALPPKVGFQISGHLTISTLKCVMARTKVSNHTEALKSKIANTYLSLELGTYWEIARKMETCQK